MASKVYSNIKSIAKSKKIPICELEKQIEISSGNMCRWKDHDPSAIALKKVAKVLDVTVDELLVDC